MWLVGAAVAAAVVLLPLSARAVASQTQSDTLWANALRSLGGWHEPFDLAVFLGAGDDVLAGRSPYTEAGTIEGPGDAPYAYPPVLALLVTPLSALPTHARDIFLPGVVFSLLLVFAIVGALLLLGVRDWRCYPVALLCPPSVETVEYGAIGPLLLLLVALLWRFRDRMWLSAGSAAVAVVLKGFLWPLFLWLAMTRRARSAVLAIVAGATLALLSWGVIAFRGIGDYPGLLRKLVDVEAENSYSAFALLRMIGVPEAAAHPLVLAAGAGLLLMGWRAARDAETSFERDRRSLTLAVAAALVLTPILWLHYLVLLLVPIALARPRLSLLWFAPLALTVFEWLDWYRGWPRGDGEALVSVAVLVTLVIVVSLGRGPAAQERHTVAARMT
jgi:alpha-1,2-mannosyltransferase